MAVRAKSVSAHSHGSDLPPIADALDVLQATRAHVGGMGQEDQLIALAFFHTDTAKSLFRLIAG